MSDTPAEWDDEATPSSTPSGAAPATAPELYYGSVDEFVREKLRYTYIRKVGPSAPYRWAGDWWRYPEAMGRLDALWRAWEALRLEGQVGMSSWWRDHADHHMRMLMAPDGPFTNSRDTNETAAAWTKAPGGTADERPLIGPLPYTAPPVGMFIDVRTRRS